MDVRDYILLVLMSTEMIGVIVCICIKGSLPAWERMLEMAVDGFSLAYIGTVAWGVAQACELGLFVQIVCPLVAIAIVAIMSTNRYRPPKEEEEDEEKCLLPH